MNFSYPSGPWLSWSDGKNTYCGNQDAYDAWLESIGQKLPKPQEVIEIRPGRCECGSEAIKAAFHSPWCPAFEK